LSALRLYQNRHEGFNVMADLPPGFLCCFLAGFNDALWLILTPVPPPCVGMAIWNNWMSQP
jgi:hypothetical protein